MDERPFFYRLRNRTLGPLESRQIRQLVRRGRLGRATEVSRDGLLWSKAGDFPELFVNSDDEAREPRSPSTERRLAGDSGACNGSGQAATTARWYYTANGDAKGPIDLATLHDLVANGTIPAHEHVIAEGGSQWLPVPSLPYFNSHALPGTLPTIDTSVAVERPSREGSLAEGDARGWPLPRRLAVAACVILILTALTAAVFWNA